MNEDKNLAEDKKPEEKIMALEKQSEEYLDGWKRAKADLINYKKEEAERFEAFAKFSTESLIVELLAIMDSFDLGLAAVQGDKKAEEGFRIIRTQLEDILKRRGLTAILAPPGAPFDPLCHEGVGEIESPEPPGTVAEEVSRGYALGGRVIRPTRVKVSKGEKITNS